MLSESNALGKITRIQYTNCRSCVNMKISDTAILCVTASEDNPPQISLLVSRPASTTLLFPMVRAKIAGRNFISVLPKARNISSK